MSGVSFTLLNTKTEGLHEFTELLRSLFSLCSSYLKTACHYREIKHYLLIPSAAAIITKRVDWASLFSKIHYPLTSRDSYTPDPRHHSNPGDTLYSMMTQAPGTIEIPGTLDFIGSVIPGSGIPLGVSILPIPPGATLSPETVPAAPVPEPPSVAIPPGATFIPPGMMLPPGSVEIAPGIAVLPPGTMPIPAGSDARNPYRKF